MSFHYLYEVYYFFRIESDILKIKAEMGTMEKQLSGLMTKSDNSVQNSMKNVKIEQVIKVLSVSKMSSLLQGSPPSLTLPCPRCPVCENMMMPPLHIYQGTAAGPHTL